MADVKLTLELKTDKVQVNLNKLGKKTIFQAAVALNAEHELIMTQAKELTPVETGALRSSGHVVSPVIKDDQVISQGGFGSATGVKNSKTGKTVSYALYVHERADAFHKAPTSWKFYERPLMDAVPTLDQRLAKRIREAIQ